MISIITSYKNCPVYLEDFLGSLRDQTYRDFEVVLACNSDVKDIDEQIRDYREDIRFRIIPDAGDTVPEARNRALKEAAGDYVFIMDADDYMTKDALELMVRALDETGAGFAYCSRYSNYINYISAMNTEQHEKKDEYARVTGKVFFTKHRRTFSSPYDMETDYRDMPADNAEAAADQAAWHLVTSRSNWNSVSALRLMVRRSVVEENDLHFDEKTPMFGDPTFVAGLLNSGARGVYVKNAEYCQHRHNDPELNPSLGQSRTDHTDRLDQLSQSFEDAISLMDDKSTTASEALYDVFTDYVIYHYGHDMLREDFSSRPENRKMLEKFGAQMKKVPETYLKKVGRWQRRAMEDFASGDTKDFFKRAKRKNRVATVQGFFRVNHRFKKYMYLKFFIKKPVVENRVFFETFQGKYFSDSPKYIYEYLIKHYPGKYDIGWSRDKEHHFSISGEGKKVTRFSLKYYYYLATSKYIVYNVRQPKWFIKRDGMVFLNTWHGTPLKQLVFDQKDVTAATPLYKHYFYLESRSWDYLISPNEFSTKVFARSFLYPEERILNTGYPRNDVLYTKNNPEDIRKLKEKIGLPLDKKVILYAPTWRDDQFYSLGKYKFDLELDLKQMREALKDEYVLILRTHYFIANHINVDDVKDFVFNESGYQDISELYLVSDILITDYSSVFFDYANLRRPELFYTYDLEKYRDVLRGFYLDIEKDVPGPLLFTTPEVIDAIRHIDDINAQYSDRYDEFYKRFCSWDDGHASERVVEFMFNGKDWRKEQQKR